MRRSPLLALVAGSAVAAIAVRSVLRRSHGARGRPLFARCYALIAPLADRGGLGDRRGGLLARADGVVLEVGAGTGQNFGYVSGAVNALVAIEPDPTMIRYARRRVGVGRAPVRLVRAVVEDLPFVNASFDTVIVTLVLCTVDDPWRDAHELRRVLRPGARLLMLEHVRSDDEQLAHWQDRLERPWARLNGGCRPNRATVDTLMRAGFMMQDMKRYGSAAVPLVEAVAMAGPTV